MKLQRIDKNRFIAWIGRSMFRLEVAFGFSSIGMDVTIADDDGDAISFSFLFGLRVFLTIRLSALARFLRSFYDRFGEREYSLKWHDGCVWWSFHNKPMEWSSRDPWWKRSTFHVTDWLLGSPQYESQLITSHKVSIPFPEGSYLWEIEMRLDIWTRARWFKQTVIRCHSKCDAGTPSDHKGPTFGITMRARDVYAAVGKITEDIYRSRKNFDPATKRR